MKKKEDEGKKMTCTSFKVGKVRYMDKENALGYFAKNKNLQRN